MVYVFTHICEGVLRTVKPGENLELLKKDCIDDLMGMSFKPLDEEAEIRDENNETVFNFNRFYELVTKLQQHPFPFHNVKFDCSEFNGDMFQAEMAYTSGRKDEVQILAKYEVDHIKIFVKLAEKTDWNYCDSIYHI